jgi:hypothetical protein
VHFVGSYYIRIQQLIWELSPWRTSSHPLNKEVPFKPLLLLNTKCPYCVQNSPLRVHTLKKLNKVQTNRNILFNIHLTSFCPLLQGIPRTVFPSGLLTSYAPTSFISHVCTCPGHLILLYFIIPILVEGINCEVTQYVIVPSTLLVLPFRHK